MKFINPRVTMWGGLLLLHLLMYATAFTQQNPATATGIVQNETGAPMPGVTVVIASEKSSFKKSAQTNSKGAFEFTQLDPTGTFTFTFSHIGYAEKTITGSKPGTANTITLQVTLEPAASNTAAEVVVVGYGKASKRDVTGAVKSVKAADFNRGIINSPEELLQGKVSGVNVTSSTGEPGGMQKVTIRGPGTLRADAQPLYVVDGMALDNSSTGGATNPLAFINPQDIESMDVLKDASATAIYGSRGANGVVIVTTKRGKAGASNTTYTFGGGISNISRKLPVFSAPEFLTQVAALGGTVTDFKGNTDWQDEITRTAYTQNHNLSMAGGTNRFNYFGSLGMQQQQGILKGNEIKRYTGRINLTQKLLDDKLTIEVNLSANNTVNRRPNIGGLIGGALSTNPTLPAFDANGKPTVFLTGVNPMATLALEKDLTTINRVLGNISGSLTLAKGLVYKLNFGIDNATGTRDIQSLPSTELVRPGRLETYNNVNRNHLIENYLTYSNNFGLHKISALAGHSYQKIFIQTRATSINNFAVSDIEPIYNPGLGQELTLASNKPSGSAYANELQSFFGRATYQYNDRYLLTATVRADGSSKFGANNKYGIFPSFSAAWILSKEAFLENSIFYNLKLRAGWGQTGTQEIPPKITQALFTSTVSGTTSYPLNGTATFPAGTTYSRLANPDLQWEVSTQTDLGVDFEFLKGALSGTVDYFRKVSENILLLVIPSDPIQPAPDTWTNEKNMNIINQGVELDLNYRGSTRGGFTYNVGGNITFIDNKVKNSPYTVITSGFAQGSGLTNSPVNGYVNGQPIGTYYLREFIGFDNTGKSVYADINKDGNSNDYDRVPVGTALPNRTYNLYFTLGYKGFDFSANFNGVSGNKIYDNTANTSFYKLLLSKGVNTTPEAIKYPEEAVTNNAPISSRFVKDGKYFRFNNCTLGYNFNPESLGLSKWVSSLRLSFTGQNLFVITPYDGYDPEVNIDRQDKGVSSYGIDYLSYPKARSFLVGVNVTF
ncbi:SusC/RagA family TonB-linked outer membrane protein [Paraflavitalea pollutisoli]|uniref:SusC/RagA family TonB-linked outer membrane protein n=1 Tax=Paraflavitalea pollutisoli TaxID=3034143 RepID=UPI0023EC9D7D|nr:SusC/RagA family TonB-linked outer membrane protein [Paraflavitalea sp. H1-2-19X]